MHHGVRRIDEPLIKRGDIVTLDYARDKSREDAPLFITLDDPPSAHYSVNVYCFYTGGKEQTKNWLHVIFDISQSRLIKVNY